MVCKGSGRNINKLEHAVVVGELIDDNRGRGAWIFNMDACAGNADTIGVKDDDKERAVAPCALKIFRGNRCGNGSGGKIFAGRTANINGNLLVISGREIVGAPADGPVKRVVNVAHRSAQEKAHPALNYRLLTRDDAQRDSLLNADISVRKISDKLNLFIGRKHGERADF